MPDEIFVYGSRGGVAGPRQGGVIGGSGPHPRSRGGGPAGGGPGPRLPPLPPIPVIPPPDPPPEPVDVFVPPILPAVIEEIVVTASRPAYTGTGIAGTAARFNLASLIAAAGGYLAVQILRNLSQRRLEEAFEEFESLEPREIPDTEVETLPIDEIIVTALRAQEYFYPPLPIFFSPDADPFVMQTVWPVQIPDTRAPIISPEIQTEPIRLPLLPVRIPQTVPARIDFQTQVLPQRLGFTNQPRPGARVGRVRDPIATPPGIPVAPGAIPGLGILDLTGSQEAGVPSFQMQPNPNRLSAKKCPPCTKTKEKKKKEKARTTCYRKMVKEGRYPKNDKSFNWSKIDCRSGREIRD
jgi:hypothetical protein